MHARIAAGLVAPGDVVADDCGTARRVAAVERYDGDVVLHACDGDALVVPAVAVLAVYRRRRGGPSTR